VVERIMTDNGNCYRSQMFRQACASHGLRHLRTRPYTPRTNGKAERFIQTCLREWAYARPYVSSEQRSAALSTWLALQYRAATHRLGRLPTGSAASPISVALFDRRDRCFVPTCFRQ